MNWLICKLRGHRWRHLRVNVRKHHNLFHLSPMAGYESVCDRCGREWDDIFGFDDDFFGANIVELSQPLPRAEILNARKATK